MLKFKISKYTIILTDSVLEIICSLKQNTDKKNESGGILLGQVTDNNIYVLQVSIPNKFDRSSRYSFSRDKDSSQIIVDHAFVNSGGKTVYLGEWHTHSEPQPVISSIDKKMIQNQFKKGQFDLPFLMLLIQGKTDLLFSVFDGKKIEIINTNI
jgi:integrative and conjugative element protein (TIGR02256 family)